MGINKQNREEMSKTLIHLARQYAERLREALGDRLVSVVFFGSARGEAGPHSDIDLFIVLEKAPRGMTRRRALLEPVREALTLTLHSGIGASTPISWKSSAPGRKPGASTPSTWI